LRGMWCWGQGRGLCAACGVAGAVGAPRVASWSRSLRCVGVTVVVFCVVCGVALPSLHGVWCCGCHRCPTCGAAVTVLVPRGCCRRRLCAASGVAGAVGAPRVVSLLRSLRRVGVAAIIFVSCVVLRRCLCAVCGVAVAVLVPRGCHGRRLCATCGVVGAVGAPHVVLRSPSFCCMWCCGCCRPVACGVCSCEEHSDVACAAAREAAMGRTQLGGAWLGGA
jgi:hypothetical protein